GHCVRSEPTTREGLSAGNSCSRPGKLPEARPASLVGAGAAANIHASEVPLRHPGGFPAVESRLNFDISRQPDYFTCGPTALQGVYRFFGDDISVAQLISEIERTENGGT